MLTWEPIYHRDKTHDWSWEDAFTRWRQFYCYLDHPGAVRRMKQQHNRRVRRRVRRELRDY